MEITIYMFMYDKLPGDPIMLLSFVNTQLRDHYKSFDAFADAFAADADEIAAKLSAIGYTYDAETNRFV